MPRSKLTTVLAVLCASSGLAHASSPDLKLSGKMYFDFTHINHKDSDPGNFDRSGFGLDVKRFYLTASPSFNDVWSAKLTTDFTYGRDKGFGRLYVKKAYLQGAFSTAAVLRVGSADMPWIPLVGSYYGYRYVEKPLVDRLKFGNSADWGAHLGGTFGRRGALSYAVSVVNGGGYKMTERSRSLDVAARLGYSPIEGLLFAVAGYSGKLGKDLASTDTQHTAQRTDVMVAWAGNGLRVGGEYFRASNWNAVLSPKADSADAYSVWASTAVAEDYAVFARFDQANLSRKVDPSAESRYLNIGLQYQGSESLKLAVVFKYDNRQFTAAGMEAGPVTRVRSKEIGVWGEFKF